MTETYVTPVILVCPISGRQQKLYSRPYIDSLIARDGSLEAVKANYIAKGVKRKTNVVDVQVSVAAVVQPEHKIVGTFSPRTSTFKTSDGDEGVCRVYENYDSV